MAGDSIFDDPTGSTSTFFHSDIFPNATPSMPNARLSVGGEGDDTEDVLKALRNPSLSPGASSAFLSSTLSSLGNSHSNGFASGSSAHSPGSYSSSSPSTSAWSGLNIGNGAGKLGMIQNQGPMISGVDGGDQWLLGDAFGQDDLDMLFFSDGKDDTSNGGLNISIPKEWGQTQEQSTSQSDAGMAQSNPMFVTSSHDNTLAPSFNSGQSYQPLQPTPPDVQQNDPFASFSHLGLGGMAGAAAWAQIQAEQMRQAQQLQEIQRQQQIQFFQQQMESLQQTQAQERAMPMPMMNTNTQAEALDIAANQMEPAVAPMEPQQIANPVSIPCAPVVPAKKPRGRPGRKPKQPSSDPSTPEEPGPMGGKHNKTERRYRQKVQVAQADLRDSVPALRVLYNTSTPEQLATTDIKHADGSVDGLPEVSRPNASAKATILNGARMYIELLQERVSGLQRKVDELESYRLAVGGESELAKWRADFNQRESLRQSELRQLKREPESDDDDDDESEDEAPKRKVARKKGDVAVRAFAAFAMSFSLVPSASTLLSHHPTTELTPGHVLSGTATPTHVIAQLPLIIAEHVFALVTRVLPVAVVPAAATMVDWTWRLLVAAVLVLVLGPTLQRQARKTTYQRAGMSSEQFAAALVGRAVTPSAIPRMSTALRLGRSATTAYQLALLALIQPNLPILRSPSATWKAAQLASKSSDPVALRTVLELPLEEAQAALERVVPTSTPLAAIAEQIALVHLSDLYARMFAGLVSRTTGTNRLSGDVSVAQLAERLGSEASETLHEDLRAILASTSRGTSAHALALVLLGITGALALSSSSASAPAAGAQAALASSLAAQELRGAGVPRSVRETLELLYPGFASTSTAPLPTLSGIAGSIDNLALASIAYIRMLGRCGAARKAGLARKSRAEMSRYVAKTAGEVRSLLSQSLSLDGVEDDGEFSDQKSEGTMAATTTFETRFESAKERLVEVLSVLGRRASKRAAGRDEDSGLEGDLDEL